MTSMNQDEHHDHLDDDRDHHNHHDDYKDHNDHLMTPRTTITIRR